MRKRKHDLYLDFLMHLNVRNEVDKKEFNQEERVYFIVLLVVLAAGALVSAVFM